MKKIIIRMLRQITQNMGQFLSLVIVICIGSFMFCGLISSIIIIENHVDRYYKNQNIADMWVKFSGLTTEEIENYKEQFGFMAEGRVVVNLEGYLRDNLISMRLYSMTDMNSIYLMEGSMPVQKNEIIVDSKFAKANQIEIGDVLCISDPVAEYVITGIGNSPENVWKTKDASTGVVQQNLFLIAYGTQNTVIDAIRNSSVTEEKYDEIQLKFEEAEDQLEEEYEKLREQEEELTEKEEETYAQLEEARIKLEDGGEQLSEATGTLNQSVSDSQEKINQGETELADAKNTINEKQSSLDENVAAVEAEYAKADAKLNEAQLQLAEKNAELKQAYLDYENAIKALEENKTTAITEIEANIQAAQEAGDMDLVNSLELQKTELESSFLAKEEKLQEQKNTLDSNQAILDENEALLKDQKDTLKLQKKQTDLQLQLAQNTINDATDKVFGEENNLSLAQQITDSQNQLAQEMLNEKQNDYEKAKSDLETKETQADDSFLEARKQIEDAKQILTEKENELQNSKNDAAEEFYDTMLSYSELLVITEDVLDATSFLSEQEGYLGTITKEEQNSVKTVKGGIDIIKIVSVIFPIVFYLVTALIMFITMSKIVENQRVQIAMMQAIGISKWKIQFGYIFYAWVAVFLGSIGPSLAGNRFIPQLLTKMFVNRYMIPEIEVQYKLIILILPLLLGLLVSSLAVLLASWQTFREVPAQAMRAKPPKKSKTIMIEHFGFLWKKLSYSVKLICRNIFLNKRRILLSSVGIVGSVGLMLTGLSLNSAAVTVLNENQDTIQYDLDIIFKDDVNLVTILNSPYRINTCTETAMVKGSYLDNPDNSLPIRLLPMNSESILLKDAKNIPLNISKQGVLLPMKAAEEMNLKETDHIRLSINEDAEWMVVNGIIEQYTGNTAYISREYAAEMDIEYEINEVFITLDNSEEMTLAADYFRNQSEVKTVITKEELVSSVGDNLQMLVMIVKIIMIAASLLTITVIFNITSIHIFERTRELATLMVLGYYRNEAGKLVFRENLVITGIGFLLGIPVGTAIFRIIIQTFSSAGILLPMEMKKINVIITLGVVYILTFGINIILRRRIKDIDMIEALKGVD